MAPRLRVLEIDAETETRRYLEQAKARLSSVFGASVLREAMRQIELTATMPGVADVAAFDRISDILLSKRSDVDLVIFDTAPTGHTLRLLAMPESMGGVGESARRSPSGCEPRSRGSSADGTQSALRGRSGAGDPGSARGSARRIRRQLTHADTAVVLVLVPERLPIEETARTLRLLEESGLQVGALVVNRTLPQGLEGSTTGLERRRRTFTWARLSAGSPRFGISSFRSWMRTCGVCGNLSGLPGTCWTGTVAQGRAQEQFLLLGPSSD